MLPPGLLYPTAVYKAFLALQAFPRDISQLACLMQLKVLLSWLELIFISVQGFLINTYLDAKHQSSWEIIMFLLEFKNTTLSNLLIS